MTAPTLKPVERAIYDAARAEALADRWPVDADLLERDGGDASLPRQHARRYETEAADVWRRLAEFKAQAVPTPAE